MVKLGELFDDDFILGRIKINLCTTHNGRLTTTVDFPRLSIKYQLDVDRKESGTTTFNQYSHKSFEFAIKITVHNARNSSSSSRPVW